MPFQPGHQINVNRRMRTGPQREHRKALRLLAMQIREHPGHDGLVDKLFKMADGIDPVTNDRIGTSDMREAIKLLMLYGHGQPAQHVILEGAIRNELISVEPRGERPRLTLEEVNERRAQLRALGVRPKVIDVGEQPMKLLDSGEQESE